VEQVRSVLEEHQVAIYLGAIAIGALAGLGVPRVSALGAAINPALAFMLFVTFLQVPLAELGSAMRNTRFLGVLLATNFILMPAATALLVQLLPDEPMLRLAVLFVLLTPCVDYVVTFTHLGRGDARLLLAATPALPVARWPRPLPLQHWPFSSVRVRSAPSSRRSRSSCTARPP